MTKGLLVDSKQFAAPLIQSYPGLAHKMGGVEGTATQVMMNRVVTAIASDHK